jgi:hypothetical protein
VAWPGRSLQGTFSPWWQRAHRVTSASASTKTHLTSPSRMGAAAPAPNTAQRQTDGIDRWRGSAGLLRDMAVGF